MRVGGMCDWELDPSVTRSHMVVFASTPNLASSYTKRAWRIAGACAMAVAAASVCLILLPGASIQGGDNDSARELSLLAVGGESPLSNLVLLRAQALIKRRRRSMEERKWTLDYDISPEKSETSLLASQMNVQARTDDRGGFGERHHNVPGAYYAPQEHKSVLSQETSQSSKQSRSREEILADWGWKHSPVGGDKRAHFVSPSASSKLWDFPDIVKYQYPTSRASFWPLVEAASQDAPPHSPPDGGTLQWPGSSSSGFVWPASMGDASQGHPGMRKAGGFLRRGDIMPVTRPWVQWSAGCTSALCPLDTPHKERALAWRYCMNHFVTNAEKRYCFAAVLSPPKPPPSCAPYDLPVDHGTVSVQPGSEEGFTPGRVLVGGHLNLVCDEGYKVVGEAHPECEASGKYTEAGTCEPITCLPYPAPQHATASPAGGVAYHDSVHVKCESGYIGEWDAVCEDGGYSKQDSCVPVTCPPYSSPSHASVSPSGIVENCQKLNITCDVGYAPSGPGSDVVCGPDGNYTGTPPECIKVECPPYVAPEHASASPTGTPVGAGESVTVTCDDGYEPAGSTTGGSSMKVECGPDKKYSPDVTCVRFCPPFQAPPHGSVSPSGTTHVGDVVTVTCDNGYINTDGGGGQAVCGEAGTYTPSEITCRKIPECPPYPAVQHGYASPAGEPVAIGGEVHVHCEQGYVIADNSSSTVICNADGTYDYPTATCVPEPTCDPYPVPIHGSVSPNGVRAHVGDQVHVSCDPGYVLGRGSSAVVTCSQDGTYDYPKDECVPLPFCPPFEPPEHGTVRPTGNVTLGNCVVLRCDDGYQFDKEGDGKENPCCIMDIVDGVVKFEKGKSCYPPDQMCEVCSDLSVCPHCFIGKKEFAGKRRDFHFD